MVTHREGLIELDGISWGAIFAGALAAAALTIILSVLGSELGMAIVSPWSTAGVSATTFGISAILWLSITQIVASGMGGFLAGRLRVRWEGVHSDEVYFRDTAHGFLTWAIALVVTVSLFASVLGSVVNDGVQTTTSLAKAENASQHATKNGEMDDAQAYYLDGLFRKPANLLTQITVANDEKKLPLAEVLRIYTKSLQSGVVQTSDFQYLSQLVSQNTGIPQAEAEKRVNDAYNSIYKAELAAKDTANKARKASAYEALWGFIALLIGALTASFTATWGGRCRD